MKYTKWQIAKPWGIPLQFHWSFLLVAAWISWQAWQPGQGFDTAELLNLSLWIGLAFLCVVLHEYGHALMARHFGIRTERILIFPLGGGAFLEKMPENPTKEILIAFAGPMVNIVMAVLMGLFIWWPGYEYRQDLLALVFNPYSNTLVLQSNAFDYTIIILFLFNLILATFNLLPAYPLDGGRIFKALLRKWMGQVLARRWSALTGIAFSFGFMWMAYQSEDWVLAIAGGFICFVGFFELERSRRELRLKGKKVKDYHRPIVHSLYQKSELQAARELARHLAERYYIVVDQWQDPIGWLSQHKMMATAETDGNTPVDDVMEKDLHYITEEADLEEAHQLMQKHGQELLLVKKGFKTVGILDKDRLRDIMAVD